VNSLRKLAVRRTPAAATAFSWPIRVYFEDADSGGIVYYANCLRFLVRALAIEYLKPSRIDDSLQVTVEPVKVGAGQLIVAQQVRREHDVLVSAEVRLACVNAARLKPVRIPQAIIIKTGTAS